MPERNAKEIKGTVVAAINCTHNRVDNPGMTMLPFRKNKESFVFIHGSLTLLDSIALTHHVSNKLNNML